MTPPTERTPKTKKEWAELNGVGERTVHNWDEDDYVKDQLRRLKSKYGQKWHAEILDELMGVVRQGPAASKVSAAKLLLNHLDLGPEEEKSQEATPEAIEQIKAALKKAGYKTT